MAAVILCSQHWDRLRVLICERGLGHLLHQPHDEFEEFAAELCGRPVRAVAFDPLDEARDIADAIARKHCGPEFRNSGCAVCELMRCLPAHDSIHPQAYWTGVVVGMVVHRARERGLMPRAA